MVFHGNSLGKVTPVGGLWSLTVDRWNSEVLKQQRSYCKSFGSSRQAELKALYGRKEICQFSCFLYDFFSRPLFGTCFLEQHLFLQGYCSISSVLGSRIKDMDEWLLLLAKEKLQYNIKQTNIWSKDDPPSCCCCSWHEGGEVLQASTRNSVNWASTNFEVLEVWA